MKTLALLLGMILLVCLSPVAASPASPIWPGSVGADGLNSYYFTNDFDPTNRLFQSNDVKVLMFSSPAGNATRYSIGYGTARKTVSNTVRKNHRYSSLVKQPHRVFAGSL